MARAQRKPGAVLGSERSIFDDLRIARSRGGLCVAKEEDLSGTIAALQNANRDSSISSAIDLLRSATVGLADQLRSRPGDDPKVRLGLEALEILLLGEVPPAQSYSFVRDGIGNKGPGFSGDAVRESEDKILSQVARNVAMSLHVAKTLQSAQLMPADQSEFDLLHLPLLRSSDTVDVIEAAKGIGQRMLKPSFGEPLPKKRRSAVFPAYSDLTDELIFDFAHLLHAVAELRRHFFVLGEANYEQPGVNCVVVTGFQLAETIETITGSLGASLLRSTYAATETHELSDFLGTLVATPTGVALIQTVRKWTLIVGKEPCRAIARYGLCCATWESLNDNEEQYFYPDELCSHHSLRRDTRDMDHIVRALREDRVREWAMARYQKMLERARVKDPETIA